MTRFISLPAAAVSAALATTRPRRSRGVRPYSVPPPRGAIIPAEMDFSMTADHLVEEPRDPRIIPTGVLDEAGNMICRVIVPIKQQMGFFTGGNAWTGDAEEEVVLLQTDNMIRMSDCGIGIESVDPAELEGDYDDEP